MKISLIGYKYGMKSFFSPIGVCYPVTIIKLYYNYVLGVRSVNGLDNLVKVVSIKCNNASKPLLGFYKKLGVDAYKFMLEFRVTKSESINYNIGDYFSVKNFKVKDKIDILGISKGKGFAGVIKRHNFSSQRNSHGNSLSHRAPGSIGQCQFPGKVFKGKKMAGHLGNSKVLIKNLIICEIKEKSDFLLVKGSVPGPVGSKLILKKM